MKKLLIASVITLATLNTVSAQEQGTIPTLRDLRNEAKVIIKDFELTDLKIEAGAPEYRAIRDIMHANIKSEISALDAHLDDLNKQLSTDYSLIVSLKRSQKNDAALKRTIEVATQRLEARANELSGAYHARLRSLILLSPYQLPLLKKCLTVLCVEKVNLDFQTWFKKAKSLNRSLDLEVTEMKEIPKFAKVVKAENEKLENSKTQVSNYLPVALTKEQYEDIQRAEQEKIDAAARAEQAKKDEEARSQRAKEEQLRLEEQTRQAKAEKLKRKENQPYGCGRLDELKANEIYKCVEPYKMVGGVKNNINALPVEVYQDVCAAHGLKMASLRASWKGETATEAFSGYYFTSVTCEDVGHNGLSRYSYGTTYLTDGSIVLNDFKIQMANNTAARLYSANEATSVCQTLGFSRSSDVKTTRFKENTSIYRLKEAGVYSWSSDWEVNLVTSFKCIK